ncbi:MAG TPA: hypothetical protein VFE51_11305 [Verrucomicrobiae bacterium]|nr:hypothetical protein [Verrucomicrobiae bacterium]
MRTSSAGKVPSLKTARNSFLINQLATPGLGSLMAGRYLAGASQLALALLGFGLIIAWFISLMTQMYRQFTTDAPTQSVAWLGETGAAIFVLAWIWSLVTSLALLRAARANEPPPLQSYAQKDS